MEQIKGILLAGGTGSRLAPITTAVNKQFLPVYDKPLVYYPLATMMLAGVRDILIITRPEDRQAFELLLGDGARFGIGLSYAPQVQPGGIAQAILIGAEHIRGHRCLLSLGDNIFFGHGLREILRSAVRQREGATIFGYWVRDPENFGVVEFAPDGTALSIEEKPVRPRSNFAIPGLYFYDSQVIDIADRTKPSERGELEITDVNAEYLRQGKLTVRRLERGFAWLDTGNPQALLDAASFVAMIEHRQGLKIACLEEIAWRSDWIDEQHMRQAADLYPNSEYGEYLRTVT